MEVSNCKVYWQVLHRDNFRFEFPCESLGLVVNMHGPMFLSLFYLQKELFVEGKKEAHKLLL